MNDLTQGSVSRQLIRYAVPVVATSLLQAIYSIVDMLVVSKMIGPAGVSGVNNASQFMMVLTQIAIGLSNGGNILVGQYFGAGDKENQEKTIGSFLSLFLILGVAASALAVGVARPFMVFMGAPALENAVSYLSVSAWGLFFVFFYNALASTLRAVGNSRAPLYCILTSTALNIVLDLLFVGPLRLGTAGAALATVIAQSVSCLLAFFYLLRHREIFSWTRTAMRLHADKARHIFKIGIPCAIQMTVAGISWLVVTYLINDYGVAYSAANGFAVKIKDFSMMFITAVATAASSMIAQNLGAKQYERGKSVMYHAMRLTLLMSAVLILIVELGAPAMMAVFTDEPQVIAAGALNLRIEILGQVFYAVFLVYHSLMLGAGDTWWVLLSSFTNCILFRVVLAVTLEHFFQIQGVFIACAIAPSISVPIGMYYTRSGRWRRSLTSL